MQAFGRRLVAVLPYAFAIMLLFLTAGEILVWAATELGISSSIITGHGIPALAAALGFLGSIGVALNLDFKESTVEVAATLSDIQERLKKLESKP
ncbi:MAG: hypothetical protein ACE5L6_05795 [Candidatus Bathyarchaeia archaeon]